MEAPVVGLIEIIGAANVSDLVGPVHEHADPSLAAWNIEQLAPSAPFEPYFYVHGVWADVEQLQLDLQAEYEQLLLRLDRYR